MTTTPLVTIGLPVYNSERYIAQSIESLLKQTYRDFRLIISDNASTDRTAEICQDYARGDARIDYHRNAENIGLSPNFNRVFALSQSKYFKWSTSDDYWAPTLLERAVEIMEHDPQIILCFPKTTLVDAQGANPEPYDDNLHLMHDSGRERFIAFMEQIRLSHQHLGVVRADLVRRTRLLGSHQDSDINFLAELTLYGKFYEIPERLFFRRFHKDSSSWSRKDEGHQQRRYHSAASARIKLTVWRWHQAFFSAVTRAPLTLGDKLALYLYLARRMRWDRVRLTRELIAKTGF
ncbi:MAG: glycosyltransferase family 2 protein [Gammaproteobacteria bacterium]|nr:glycosyltransferase family 2 protein [Gammaproteobacteria bacterium]